MTHTDDTKLSEEAARECSASPWPGLITTIARALSKQREEFEAERNAALAAAYERAAKVCFDVVLQWKLPLPIDDRVSTDIRNQIATAIRALSPAPVDTVEGK